MTGNTPYRKPGENRRRYKALQELADRRASKERAAYRKAQRCKVAQDIQEAERQKQQERQHRKTVYGGW